MRRNWKRILSLLLTVAMVFTMNTSVFAATDYNSSNLSDDVTFNNGDTYTAADGTTVATYKVADGETDGKWYVGEDETTLDALKAIKPTVYQYNDKYYTKDGTEVTDYSEDNDKYTLSKETVRSLVKYEGKDEDGNVTSTTYYEVEKDGDKYTKVSEVENATELEKVLATSAEKVPEVEGDQENPEKKTVYAVNGKYYTADGTEVTDYSEGSDKYTLSKETVRSLVKFDDKFYAVTKNDDDKVTKVEEITDATDLEKALATSADKKPEVEVIVEDGEGNAEIKDFSTPTDIGWSLVKDGSTDSVAIEKFFYNDKTNPYKVTISADLVAKGYYLQASSGAKPITIEVLDDNSSNYTVSVSGIKDAEGKGTGEPASILTSGSTKIALSDNGTRLFGYGKSDTEAYADLTDAAYVNVGNKMATGSTELKLGNIPLNDYKKAAYIVIPKASSTIGTVSLNESEESPNGNEYNVRPTVVYKDMNYVVAGKDDNNAVASTENKVIRVKFDDAEDASGGIHNIYGITETKDRSTIMFYKQVVVTLSNNGIAEAAAGANNVWLGGALVKGAESDSINVSYNGVDKANYQSGTKTLVEDYELSVISGDGISDGNRQWWIASPLVNGKKDGKLANTDATARTEKASDTFTGLKGNTEYYPIIRTVSAADKGYLDNDVLYVPSKWYKSITAITTRPAAGVLEFAKTEVTNIGRTTASVNIGMAADADYVIAGIYVTTGTTAPEAIASENCANPGSGWIVSDNSLNAKGNFVGYTVGSTMVEAKAGVPNLAVAGTFTFNVSANNGLEPGKLYNVYALGYFRKDANTALDTKDGKMIVSSEPILTFGTVSDYAVTLGEAADYEGENFKFDAKQNSIEIGAHYKGYSNGSKVATDNAFYNLEVKGLTMTVMSKAGKLVEIGKDGFTKLLAGNDYNGLTSDEFKSYLFAAETEAGDSITTYADLISSLNTSGTNAELISRYLKKSNAYYEQKDDEWTNTLPANKEKDNWISGNDVGKSGYELTISINEAQSDTTRALYPGFANEAAKFSVTPVNTDLYVYPGVDYGTGNSSVSDGSISRNMIRYNVVKPVDSEPFNAIFNYDNATVRKDASLAAFRLVRVDSGKETVVQTFSASTKFPVSIPEGEYRLQLTNAALLASDTASDMTGYDFLEAPAGKYDAVKVASYPKGVVYDYKGSYPYIMFNVDPTGDGTIAFTITRDTTVPIAYGTMSANDLKEAYLASAFKQSIVNSTNKNYNYADADDPYSSIQIRFVATKSEADVVASAVSTNKPSAFAKLKEVKLESVQAGTTVYAVMLVKLNNKKFHDYFGYQAAVAPVKVEKRAITLSWNGGVAKYGTAVGQTIAKFGRGDKETFAKGVSLTGEDLKYFNIYAQDASGNAIKDITKTNASEAWAAAGAWTAVNGGYQLKSTGEVISPAIFAAYNGSTNVVTIPATKATNVVGTTVFDVNTANVDIATSGTYGVSLKKNPTLSTNKITLGSGSSAKTYNGFGNNFEIKSYSLDVEITQRTTVTFKASFGSNTLSKTFELKDVTTAGTAVKTAAFTDAAKAAGAEAIRSSFYTNATGQTTPSANVINVFSGIGAGKVIGYKYAATGSSSFNPTDTDNDLDTQFSSITINPDEDVVIQAVIEVSVTPEVKDLDITYGEKRLNVQTIDSVVYDGRTHVIKATNLKYNLTSKVNDVDLTITPKVDTGVGTEMDGIPLILGTDFTVSYKNNKDANIGYDENGNTKIVSNKQPQVIVTGKGNYKGLKLTLNFDIVANDLATSDITGGYMTESDGTQFAEKGYDAAATETNDGDIIVINDYIRIGNDKTGTALKPKFVIERTFASKENAPYVTTKKVTLGKKDYTASIYRKVDGSWQYVGPLSTKITNTLAKDEGQDYQIRVVGQGNYQGTITKTVHVFKKSSTKLLDNATPAWSKTLNKIKFADNTTLTSIVPSVKMKDGNVYSVKNNGGDANVYKLKIVNKITGESIYEDANGAVQNTLTDLDSEAGKDGIHLLPGKYIATLVANEAATDENNLAYVYGESKPKTFTVKAEKLPAVTVTAYRKSAVDGKTWNQAVTDAGGEVTSELLAKATIETSGKSSKAVNEKNRTLDFTGYGTYLDVKLAGYTNDYFEYGLNEEHIAYEPGTSTITVVGKRQFKGQTKKLTFKRNAMTMKNAVKDYGFDMVVVEKPKQNINGAMFNADNANADKGFYFTFLGENVGYVMSDTGAPNPNNNGTQEWSVTADYDKNIEYVYFVHKVSQNEAHKGETYKGVLQLKFANNTNVSDKAKVTVTGLAKWPGFKWDTESFITGGGLKAKEFSIQAATIEGKAGSETLHRYNAIDVANGTLDIQGGEFYYTVEDSYVDSKGNWKAPTFKLYQAPQGASSYEGAKNYETMTLNTKKSISTKDVDIAFTLSENAPKNITGAVGTLTAVGDNYKVKTTGGGEGGKDKDAIDIDGVYLYTKKVTLPKDGITLNTYTTQTKDNVRWLKTDEKGNLVYTYNGLNVDIGASLKSLTLNSGKDNSVTIDSTNGDVKTAVGSAIEIIDLKPNTLAQTSGKYTATVRIRPDVVQKGRTNDAAGEQYGGTIKITFTVRDMDKDPDVAKVVL